MAGPTASKKLRITAVLITALALVVGAVFWLGLPKESQKRVAPEEIVTFVGLPKDTTVSATLTMGGRTDVLPVIEDGLRLTAEQRTNFFLPYSIKATLQSEKGGYRDISWSIDRRGAEYYILADGFTSKDTISLSIDGQKVYTIPFDWSGRIELPIISRVDKDTTACINIQETGDTLAFCHYLTGRPA